MKEWGTVLNDHWFRHPVSIAENTSGPVYPHRRWQALAMKKPLWSTIRITEIIVKLPKGAKLGRNNMQHAKLIPEIHEFSMLAKMRQRARSLDAFSHLYRDFQYRLKSTYTFSESSRHSEHNDMRQSYVLINRLGCGAPWRVRWRHSHVRGRKKLLLLFTA